MAHSVAQNTLWMTIAAIGQKIVAFVYFALIARMLGPELQGVFTTALTMTTIVVVFVDLGLSNVLVREIAKKKEAAQVYFSNLLGIKLILGFFAYFSLFFFVHMLGYDLTLRHLVYLSGITMLFDSFHLTVYAVFRALGNLRYESLAMFGSQFATLVLGGSALYLQLPLMYLIVAFTLPSICNALFASVALWKRYHIVLRPSFEKKHLQMFLHIGLPFAVAAIFARVYSFIDTILLQKMLSNVAVGWYSAAQKIAFAFQFIPYALVAGLYPRLSELFHQKSDQLKVLMQQSILYMFLVAVPISIGIAVLAEPIILLVYEDAYRASVFPLQILMGSLVFAFLSFPFGALLNACDRQKTQTMIVGLVMLINIGMNLWLIPFYGVVGASIAALVSGICLVVFGSIASRSIISLFDWYLLSKILRILFAGAIMAVAVSYSTAYFSLLLQIALGAMIYIVLVFMLRILKREDIETMRIRLFQK